MKTSVQLILLSVVLTLAAGGAVDAKTYGKKKAGTKGRYLVVEKGVDLSAYAGGTVLLEPAEIVSDKDKPVDTESVRTTSDQMLKEDLGMTGLFASIQSGAGLAAPASGRAIRLTTQLNLQHGSQAMRFFVGAGAGKSKLHIKIDIADADSGRLLASFNGYGTGAGWWSISGGGVQRMARDDLEENYKALREYLVEAMR